MAGNNNRFGSFRNNRQEQTTWFLKNLKKCVFFPSWFPKYIFYKIILLVYVDIFFLSNAFAHTNYYTFRTWRVYNFGVWQVFEIIDSNAITIYEKKKLHLIRTNIICVYTTDKKWREKKTSSVVSGILRSFFFWSRPCTEIGNIYSEPRTVTRTNSAVGNKLKLKPKSIQILRLSVDNIHIPVDTYQHSFEYLYLFCTVKIFDYLLQVFPKFRLWVILRHWRNPFCQPLAVDLPNSL